MPNLDTEEFEVLWFFLFSIFHLWFIKNIFCRGSVCAAASTGIASLLLLGGATAHRQFFVPNDVTMKTPVTISAQGAKAEQLDRLQVIVIDVNCILFILNIIFFILAGNQQFEQKSFALH